MNENVAAAVKTPPFTITLIARQSYDVATQQYQLSPRIDQLTNFGTSSAIEAWEAYVHLDSIADLINGEIEEAIENANEAADSGDDTVIDISEDDDDETVVNFAKFFDPMENPSMAGLAIAATGYSNLSVYIKMVHANRDEPTYAAPEDFNQFMQLWTAYKDGGGFLVPATLGETGVE